MFSCWWSVNVEATPTQQLDVVTRRFDASSCGTGHRGSRRKPARDGQTPPPGSGLPSPSLWSCSSAVTPHTQTHTVPLYTCYYVSKSDYSMYDQVINISTSMWLNRLLFLLPNSRTTQVSLPRSCSSKTSKAFDDYLMTTMEILCLFADPVYRWPCFAAKRRTERSEPRQREVSDLLNIECCHGDDVIDVRASANLLHVGQVPFRHRERERERVIH